MRILVNSDPFKDILIAEVGGQMAGYSRVQWRDDQTNQVRVYTCFGYIRPEWRRQGIGRAMPPL